MTPEQERYIDTIRKAAFPTPSLFGVEWEKQRATEAYTLIHRWAQGRTENGADLGTGNRDGGLETETQQVIDSSCVPRFGTLAASPFRDSDIDRLRGEGASGTCT
jgi:hypothetical protein